MKFISFKTAIVIAMTCLALSSFHLSVVAEESAPPAPATASDMLQEMAEVSGKAGALKMKLLKENPTAQAHHAEIKSLQQRIIALNEKIDELLSKESAEYKQTLARKNALSARYRMAKDAATEE